MEMEILRSPEEVKKYLTSVVEVLPKYDIYSRLVGSSFYTYARLITGKPYEQALEEGVPVPANRLVALPAFLLVYLHELDPRRLSSMAESEVLDRFIEVIAEGGRQPSGWKEVLPEVEGKLSEEAKAVLYQSFFAVLMITSIGLLAKRLLEAYTSRPLPMSFYRRLKQVSERLEREIAEARRQIAEKRRTNEGLRAELAKMGRGG